MSTLRISNIEAKSVPASATIDEKVKITNSSGDVLVFLDGKTSGITTVGINTTDGNITFDANSNVVVTGIITATKFVGTIEPTNLTVGGDLTISDKIIHSGDTNTAIRFPSADTISVETDSTERLRISSNGLVNIGAGSNASGLSPLLHLHKNASNSTAYLHITNNTTGITNNDGFLLGINGVGDCLVFNKDSTPIRFATAGLERVRIDSSGQLTIGGNSSVGTKVHVENSSGDAHIRLRGSANCGVLYTRHSDGALIGYTGSGNAVNLGSSNLGISASLSGGNIIFQTGGTASTNERLRITAGAAEQATLVIDNSQTNGNTWIGDNYTASATEYTCTIGNMYSGAGFFVGYGLKPKSDGWGFVSSTDAYGDRRSCLTLNGTGYDALRVDVTNNNNTHTTGADVTTARAFAVKHNGDVEIPDGNLIVANGHGIDFSNTANGSGFSQELLDDYEEGNFNGADVSGGGLTLSHTNTGRYVKVGRQVYVIFDITYPSNSDNNLTRVSNPYSADMPYGGGWVGWNDLGRPMQVHVSGTNVYFMDCNSTGTAKHLYNYELSGRRIIGGYMLMTNS